MARFVRVEGVKETIAEMRKLEPGLIKEMRAEMKTIASPTMSKIKTEVPVISPLNGGLRKTGLMRPYGGMNSHAGRSRWDGVKVSTALTPSIYARGKNAHPLVSIIATGRKGVGFDYAELAGIRRRPPRQRSRSFPARPGGFALNGQGDAMIEKLNRAVPFKGKAGRFAFAVVLKDKKDLEQKSQVVLNKYADKINIRLRA
jgi:hypothetical protein